MNYFKNLGRDRMLLWISIFFTGASALLYQNIWHRYMSIMLGAEAKSGALVVSLFLVGLSCGSYYWGLYTRRPHSKRHLIKLYAFMEFVLAGYGLLFPLWFKVIHALSIALPQSFVLDILLASVLILPPTFLMGGTIPLLTTVLPKRSGEVADMHRWIYGINTLGAFLGAVFGGIPVSTLGMGISCGLAAAFNLICGIIFYRTMIEGEAQNVGDFPNVLKRLKPWHLIVSSFLSGTIIIALEMITIRLAGLAIGSSHVIFPMVIGVFILFLSLAALFNGDVSEENLYKNFCYGSILLLVPVLSGHLWPLWASFIRLKFDVSFVDYVLFHLSMFLSLALILGPAIFFIGRTLPLSYSLYPKTRENYGLECGRIYAINTIGTFIGAIILGHLLWGFLSLEHVLKLTMSVLVLYSLYLSVILSSVMQNVVLASVLFLSWIFPWVRTYHSESLFRKEREYSQHQKGLFHVMRPEELGWESLFFEDGTIATVAVNRYLSSGGLSVLTNGKSDSSTTGDFSTIVFAGALPYFYLPTSISNAPLKALVVGLGTGVTVGYMAKFENVGHVDVAEISDTIAKALPKFDPHSLDASKEPKIQIHLGDAFRFLARASNYDIIVSEPTNPWVVGTENLFTPEYYQLVKKALTPNGKFAQWFHLYSMDQRSLSTVFKNYSSVFPEYCLFQTSTTGDILLLNTPPPCAPPASVKGKMQEMVIKQAMNRMGIPPIPESLATMLVYDSHQINQTISGMDLPEHGLYRPTLGKMAWQNFFRRDYTNIDDLVTSFQKISGRRNPEWVNSAVPTIQQWLSRYESNCFQYPTTIGYNPFCDNWDFTMKQMTRIQNGHGELVDLLEDYIRVRSFHYMPYNGTFLKDCHARLERLLSEALPSEKNYWVSLLFKLMEIYTLESKLPELKELLTWSLNKGYITEKGQTKALENFNYFQQQLAAPKVMVP